MGVIRLKDSTRLTEYSESDYIEYNTVPLNLLNNTLGLKANRRLVCVNV